MIVVEKIKAFLKIDEALSEARIHHIDALKGFVIICVVWGHSILLNDPDNQNNLLLIIPYPLAMPLFMLLSGFIISKQLNSTFLNYLKKNAIRLLVPFFVWYLIYYVFLRFQNDVSLFSHLYLLIQSPANGLWFLWVLFWSSLLLFAALKIARYKNWLRWENYFVVAAIILSRVFSMEFFGFSEIKAYFVYYAAGFFICKYLDVLIDKRRIVYAIALVVFPILVFSWRREQFPTFYPVLLQIVNDKGIARLIVSIYRWVVAFAGMAFWSFIMERINKTRVYFFLCWVGTMTLDIYVCQQYFVFKLGNSVWYYLAATAIGLTCSLALTLLLMKRFKITRLLLLGQTDKKKVIPMSIKSYLYEKRPEIAVASEFYSAYRDFRKAGFKKTPYGFLMAGPASMVDGSYEVDETKNIITCLKDAEIFIDIGANVGYYTCIARFMNMKVLAVEPLWHNLQYIYHNLNINNWTDVEVYPVGLADKPGLAVLYGVGTAASFIKDWSGVSTKMRMVPLSTLDIIASKRFSGKKIVIKIDVEGIEYRVLKGAPETMSLSPAPIWIIETGLTGHFPGGHNADFIKVFETFWSRGYSAYAMIAGQENMITEAKVRNWVKNLNTEGHYNFLFQKEK